MKLRILGHEVKIERGDPGIGRDVFGSWDRQSMTIRISNSIDPGDQASTLLHEVLHAVVDFMDISIEEGTVGVLSQSLYQVLVDNPNLLNRKEPLGEAK